MASEKKNSPAPERAASKKTVAKAPASKKAVSKTAAAKKAPSKKAAAKTGRSAAAAAKEASQALIDGIVKKTASKTSTSGKSAAAAPSAPAPARRVAAPKGSKVSTVLSDRATWPFPVRGSRP